MDSVRTSSAPATPIPARVRVLIPLPLSDAYDYAVPEGMTLVPGDIVVVPLGPREVIGVVWDDPTDPAIAASRLRPVLEIVEAPAMTASLRRTIDWVSAYTLAPRGNVLRMALPVSDALGPPRTRAVFAATGLRPAILTDARRRVLAVLEDGFARSTMELAEEAGVSPGVIRGLADAGALAEQAAVRDRPFPDPDPDADAPVLSPAQKAAADDLVARVASDSFSAVLLEGVTGSGKTEVYFEAIATALRAGRSALVLLPEIALTAQWLDRFEARFGVRPAPWHSELPSRERRRVWRMVAEGKAPAVVGARSALFLPFVQLGVLVVDEEHDPSFKQEEGVIYNARDMAVVRARASACPVILSTATPSLETLANVESGRYGHVVLPDRHGVAEMPTVQAIDLRHDTPPRGRWLSPLLEASLRDTVENGEQALLFLNRRGYAPLTLCRTCGHRLQCPHCTAWLVEHRHSARLQCHHCGFSGPRPGKCPTCEDTNSFVACGPGVERLAEELATILPDARVAVMASDTLTGPASVAELVRQVTDHEIDILIGTQVVAKGHHFPMLTLVGVVDADLGLAGGDLRAAERTYQLLAQVSGRAGRAERAGRVLLQTYMPEHPVIHALASGDRAGFMAQEKGARLEHGMPPYGRLVALIVSSADMAAADRYAQALARQAPRQTGINVLGPAPAPLALLRGRHRRRLLLKAGRDLPVQAIVRDWVARVPAPGTVRLQIDIDPYSFF